MRCLPFQALLLSLKALKRQMPPKPQPASPQEVVTPPRVLAVTQQSEVLLGGLAMGLACRVCGSVRFKTQYKDLERRVGDVEMKDLRVWGCWGGGGGGGRTRSTCLRGEWLVAHETFMAHYMFMLGDGGGWPCCTSTFTSQSSQHPKRCHR